MTSSSKNSNSANILDMLSFDITDFFNKDYQIIGTEDSPAIQIVNYELALSNTELEIFDNVHLMVMFDKFFITSDTHMNATFRSKKKELTIDDIKKTTNFFYKILGTDDSKYNKWSKADVMRIDTNSFYRIWPTGMGDSFIKLAYKKDSGFELSILFLNNLLESLGKKILFN